MVLNPQIVCALVSDKEKLVLKIGLQCYLLKSFEVKQPLFDSNTKEFHERL